MAKQQVEPKSRLRYDLFTLKKGEQVVDCFEDLQAYPAFMEHGSGKDNDIWLRFAILYADAGSEYRNLPIDKKRARCMDVVGVAATHPRRAAVLAGTDAAVLALIIEYVRLQDWLEYATVFTGREYVWRLLAEVATPGDDLVAAEGEKSVKPTKAGTKDKTASMKYALDTVQVLDARWNALFMADPEVKGAAQAQGQRDKLTSESRAEGRKFIPDKTGKE